MLEVGDDSRLIEEFFRYVMCGRESKHWGTLREKQEEGGGPEDTVTYRMWTDSNRHLKTGKSYMLFNVNIHPDRYRTFASLETLLRRENSQEERQEREA